MKKSVLSAVLVCLVMTPAMATEVFTGGQDGYGAKVNDLGGANINYNTGKEAQIGVTGNGNVVKWDYLNVGAGNKLDFNFTQAGQVAVNKVIGGVSKFAGTVSTSGENGHLVISNPNGMIFMNGAVVQIDAGSATFTTHEVNWDGQKNGQIVTKNDGRNIGITVGEKQNTIAPVFKINEDLNLIAPGLEVSRADLFAGGTVRLISADGVNFVAGANTIPDSTTRTKVRATDVMYAQITGNEKVHYVSGNNGGLKLSNVRSNADIAVYVDDKLYLYSKDKNEDLRNLADIPIGTPDDIPSGVPDDTVVDNLDDIPGDITVPDNTDNSGSFNKKRPQLQKSHNRSQSTGHNRPHSGGPQGQDSNADNTDTENDASTPAGDAWRHYQVDEDIDTVFRKQFNPRSFATSEHEIAKMKHDTAKNTTHQNGTIKIQKGFHVH